MPALLVAVMLCAGSAAAQETLPRQSRLQDIARQFAERIGDKMDEADRILQGRDKLKLQELKTGAVIPEGEMLILRGHVGPQRLLLGREIIAVKQNGRLLVSLADITAAIEFPITIVPSDGTASGWFIREDNNFYLDVGKKEVTIAAETSRIDSRNIMTDGGDILVAASLMEEWFGIGIDIDTSGLSAHITAAEPLPIEMKEKRKKQQRYVTEGNGRARLPLQEEPYKVYSRPYLDVAMGALSSRPDGATPTRNAASWSAIGAGDMLGLSTRAFANGSWNSNGTGEGINTLRLTFLREDPDGIGRAGIRSLSFGDVNTVNLPIIGGATQEQGVYLSNRLQTDATTQSRIDIQGDWQPGWDVELYNTNSILGTQSVGNDGRYNFKDVFLFEGENIIRLVFYGPQGEVREETRRIVSHASTLSAGQGRWEASLTRANQTTYNALRSNQPNDGDPQFAARYEHSFGPQASVNAGVSRRSDFDGTAVQDKTYLQGGVATNLMGALVTADAAYDVDGEYAFDMLARRTFGEHQTGFRFLHSSGAFPQGGLTSFAPENQMQANVRGPFAGSFLGLSSVTYTGDASFTQDRITETVAGSAGLNGRAGNFGIGSSLRYNRSESAVLGGGATVTPRDDRLGGATSVRGSMGRGRWRLATDYGFQPFEINGMNANYTHPFTPNLQGIAQVSHDNDKGLTELQLSARWRHDKFVLSPRLLYDTNDAFAVGVNLNFSLADDPYGKGYALYSRGLTNAGGASARVFLDKNGDGVYSDGDELLPDVTVQSLQSASRGVTGKQGVAFLPSLQRGLRTDVVVRPETLPDPYYLPAHDGHSVLPRPGHTSSLDFPVVVGGELDGQVGFAGGKKLSLRGAEVRLVTPGGKVAQVAPVASDGYYTMSGIRPGVYYLVAETGKSAPAGSAAPRRIVFSPEGSIFFGENILFAENDKTRFDFVSINKPPFAADRARIPQEGDIAGQSYVIRLGEYRSRLALALAWYRLKLLNPLEGIFAPFAGLDDIAPDTRTGLLRIPMLPRRAVDMEQAIQACRILQAKDYACTVETRTRYREAPSRPAKTAKAAK